MDVAEGTILVRYDGDRIGLDDFARAFEGTSYELIETGPVRVVDRRSSP